MQSIHTETILPSPLPNYDQCTNTSKDAPSEILRYNLYGTYLRSGQLLRQKVEHGTEYVRIPTLRGVHQEGRPLPIPSQQLRLVRPFHVGLDVAHATVANGGHQFSCARTRTETIPIKERKMEKIK